MLFIIKPFLEQYFAHSGGNSAIFPCQPNQSGGLTLRQASQSSPGKVQIGQRTENKQGMGVFGETKIADLGKSKYPLHDPKEMLDFSPNFRLGTVTQSIAIRQRFISAAFCLGKIFGAGCATLNHITLAGIGRVTPDACFITMQQVFKYLRIMNIGGSRGH